MADPVKTCANCGHTQTGGEFCEVCGTKLPEVAESAAAPAAEAAAPAAQSSEAAWAGSAGAGAAAAGAGSPPAPGYAPPGYPQHPGYHTAQPMYGSGQGSWGRLFDLSCQGFIVPRTIKTVFGAVLGLVGAWILFSIIILAITGAGYRGIGVLSFFVTVFIAVLVLLVSRVLLEIAGTMNRVRDKVDK